MQVIIVKVMMVRTTDDINRSDVAGSDVGSDDECVGREGGHACGSLIGFEKEIADDDSNSSYDVGPYWEASGCIPLLSTNIWLRLTIYL
jgi:hypothetical protein